MDGTCRSCKKRAATDGDQCEICLNYAHFLEVLRDPDLTPSGLLHQLQLHDKLAWMRRNFEDEDVIKRVMYVIDLCINRHPDGDVSVEELLETAGEYDVDFWINWMATGGRAS